MSKMIKYEPLILTLSHEYTSCGSLFSKMATCLVPKKEKPQLSTAIIFERRKKEKTHIITLNTMEINVNFKEFYYV